MIGFAKELIGFAAVALGGSIVIQFGPKLGPLRALILALRSKVSFAPERYSQRTTDVAKLRSIIERLPKDDFIRVYGEKGVGKSTIIDTAVAHRVGVLRLSLDNCLSRQDVRTSVHRALAGLPLFLDPEASAKRVIKWHTRLFRCRPVVILGYDEHTFTGEFNDFPAASRSLALDGLIVIVDASTNMQPEKLTGREELFLLGPMSKDVLLQLPQFQQLFARLRGLELLDAVWDILGGVPTAWEQLNRHYMLADDADFVSAVKDTVVTVVKRAAKEWRNQLTFSPYMASVHRLFADTDTHRGVDSVADGVVTGYLVPLGKSRPVPDKVLRLVPGEILEPATPTMAVILRLGLSGVVASELSFDQLVARINKSRASGQVGRAVRVLLCFVSFKFACAYSRL